MPQFVKRYGHIDAQARVFRREVDFVPYRAAVVFVLTGIAEEDLDSVFVTGLPEKRFELYNRHNIIYKS